MTFDLHQAFQDLMKEKAEVLCGYHVIHGERETRTHIQVDYFCIADLDRPYTGPETGIRPLADFTRFNVIELEGLGRTLDERRLRYHIGRTLVMENAQGKTDRQGATSLTILAVHKPVKLLAHPGYRFEAASSWKFRTRALLDLPVTIIALRELQHIQGGEPLAWLQLLEPDRTRRPEIWANILDQEMTGRDRLKSIMMKIDEEAFMTIAEEYRTEGRIEGRNEGRIEGRNEGRNKGLAEGRSQGQIESLIKVTRNLIHRGCEPSFILEVTGLSHDQFLKIKTEMG